MCGLLSPLPTDELTALLESSAFARSALFVFGRGCPGAQQQLDRPTLSGPCRVEWATQPLRGRRRCHTRSHGRLPPACRCRCGSPYRHTPPRSHGSPLSLTVPTSPKHVAGARNRLIRANGCLRRRQPACRWRCTRRSRAGRRSRHLSSRSSRRSSRRRMCWRRARLAGSHGRRRVAAAHS